MPVYFRSNLLDCIGPKACRAAEPTSAGSVSGEPQGRLLALVRSGSFAGCSAVAAAVDSQTVT